MDKLTRFREIARRLVEDYAACKPSNGKIDSYPVIDTEGDHYLAVNVGWDDGRRVDATFIHLDIIENKIWIQFNGTNRPIAKELVAAGVLREDIVLGFKRPNLRQYTGYGVG